jgi:hypothetical protein
VSIILLSCAEAGKRLINHSSKRKNASVVKMSRWAHNKLGEENEIDSDEDDEKAKPKQYQAACGFGIDCVIANERSDK